MSMTKFCYDALLEDLKKICLRATKQVDCSDDKLKDEECRAEGKRSPSASGKHRETTRRNILTNIQHRNKMTNTRLSMNVEHPGKQKWKQQPFLASLDKLDNLLKELKVAQISLRIENGLKEELSQQENNISSWKSRLSIDQLIEGLDDMNRTMPEILSIPTNAKCMASATKELEDLMASLSDFKVTKSVHCLHNGTKFEIQDSISEKSAQKHRCHTCKGDVHGQVISALGQMYHPEHFTCAHCDRKIGSANFFERNGKPYCEKDYYDLFSPKCSFCHKSILDKMITALEKNWHPEHFFCTNCSKPFGDEGFHENEKLPYCKDCYFVLFAPRCFYCKEPITQSYVSALNNQWHPHCFVCTECHCLFDSGSFYEYENKPYCELHYHQKRGLLCATCQKPISGHCITAMAKKYHPHHFLCSFCLKELNKGTFKERNEKPYCHQCYLKLFG